MQTSAFPSRSDADASGPRLAVRDTARRRLSILGLTAAATSLGLPAFPRAQDAHGVRRMICGYPPGGSVDLVARKLGEWLTEPGGAPPRTEHKPRAAGRIAVEELKRSPADASALLVTPASVMTMYPHVYQRLSYDPFQDVTPVSIVATTAFVLAIGPDVPAQVVTVEAFRRWCAGRAEDTTCGNAGSGSMPHFMAILYARESTSRMTHVPYRGGAAAMRGAAASEVTCAIGTESAARPLVEAGRLRVLATTQADGSAFFPKAPSFGRIGMPGLDQREWFGVFASGGSPGARARAISERLRIALQAPDVRSTWQNIGLTVAHADPDGLREAMRREHAFWGPLIRESGFVPEK